MSLWSVLGTVGGGLIGSIIPGVGTGIGAAIGAGLGGSVGGAIDASNAQTDAAKANAATANQSLAVQQQINTDNLNQQKDLYNQDVARNKPFYDTGVTANANLDKMVNGGYNVQQSPAAQYALKQGTKSLNRNLAARGLLGSGNAAQRLSELSSGVAANDYNQQYSRLLDQVKIGTGASASTGAASQTLGGQIGQNSANMTNAVGTNSLANQQAQYQAGQGRASLYSGLGGLPMSAASLGINASRAGLLGNSSPEITDPFGTNFGANNASSGGL
jgi:hypothetical protein